MDSFKSQIDGSMTRSLVLMIGLLLLGILISLRLKESKILTSEAEAYLITMSADPDFNPGDDAVILTVPLSMYRPFNKNNLWFRHSFHAGAKKKACIRWLVIRYILGCNCQPVLRIMHQGIEPVFCGRCGSKNS